jgi:Fe-S cluster assembly scaffold protein SufB
MKETIWLQMFMEEIGFHQNTPTPIEQDNQSTIALVQNLTHHNQTKHIDITHHFIHELIDKKHIELHYVLIANILANVMTKPLAHTKFKYC